METLVRERQEDWVADTDITERPDGASRGTASPSA